MKRLFIVGMIIAIVILILPAVLVAFIAKKEEAPQSETVSSTKVETVNEHIFTNDDISIAVYRSKEERIEKHPLEQYVVGVVASEMPVQFELEALKAQALAARTYIVRQMLSETDIILPEGAIVTDTIIHQVFQNEQELQDRWGKDYQWKIEKIKEAVAATSGQILTYKGEPIEASFFSTSNGYTENSEDYWQNKIPYLRSVASPWDRHSPKYKTTTTMPVSQFEQRLGVKVTSETVGDIIERTTSNRVKKVSINGKQFSGREIREKLELNSTDFTWRKAGNEIVIETKGWGHGVGMSQYGAEGMAKEGKTYEEIVRYYYQGVDITSIDQFVQKLMAKAQ